MVLLQQWDPWQEKNQPWGCIMAQGEGPSTLEHCVDTLCWAVQRTHVQKGDFFTPIPEPHEILMPSWWKEGGFLQLGGWGLRVCSRRGGRCFLPEQKGACLATGKRRDFVPSEGV